MPKKFKDIINDIDKKVEFLGNVVVKNLNLSVEGYCSSKEELCNLVISKNDEIIKNLESLEMYAVKALCLYRPVSKDLRKLLTIIKLCSMLEKIEECAVKISLVLLNSKFNFDRNDKYIRKMSSLTNDIILLTISSYINEDIDKINEIYIIHKNIEKIFYEEFQRYLARKIFEDVFNVAIVNELTNVGKYLERCENSANDFRKEIYFLVTGKKMT